MKKFSGLPADFALSRLGGRILVRKPKGILTLESGIRTITVIETLPNTVDR